MGASITIQGKTFGMLFLVIFMFVLGAIVGALVSFALGLVVPTIVFRNKTSEELRQR